MIIDNFEILECNKPKRFGPSRLEFWFARLLWVWIAIVGVGGLAFFVVLSCLVLELLIKQIT